MESSDLEWDARKAELNIKRHEVSFDEAATVLTDPFSITITDTEHSTEEQRFIDIGTSEKNRVLVVVYTERGSRIRIISSRKANPSERRIYEESKG